MTLVSMLGQLHMPMARQPRQPDCSHAPASVSSPGEQELSYPLPTTANENRKPFEAPATHQAHDCDDTSWHAIHFEWANQKLPTIASCDKQADSMYIFHN